MPNATTSFAAIVDTSQFSPYPARFVFKDAKAGAVNTVSGVTVTATDRDRLFTGTQIIGTPRLSGDGLERISYLVSKVVDNAASTTSTVVIGSDTGFRYQPTQSSLENTAFFVFKRASGDDIAGRADPALILDNSQVSPYPARFIAKSAKIGVPSTQATIYQKLSDAASGFNEIGRAHV